MVGIRPYLAMRAITALVVGLLLTSCGGGHHFHTTTRAETTSTPPYLELRSEHAVGTLHFPRGIYVLDAVDDKGYYYRAPRRIVQHSFSGTLSHNGGIFVSKREIGRASCRERV